jgi:hypothetical protein
MATSNKKILFWDSKATRDFIEHAKNSDSKSGKRDAYSFNKMPKIECVNNLNAKKSMMTDALGSVIYNKYKTLPFHCYTKLCQRLASDRNTIEHYNKNIIPMVKGNTGYNIITENKYNDVFTNSDLDIVIYINPNLPSTDFNFLQHSVHIIVSQVISQYKRCIDHMFFDKRMEHDISIFTDEEIQSFKDEFEAKLEELNASDSINGKFMSPFSSDYEARNFSSKFSFIVTKTKNDDEVVNVEVPHLYQCDRIPLKKTPLYVSYNDTISFNRSKDTSTVIKGEFDLFRVKLNSLFLSFDKNDSGMKKVSADLVDICIPKKEDAELINFWNNNRCVVMYDNDANSWVYVPDIMFSIKEIGRMIDLYNSPDEKKNKRIEKRKVLIDFFKKSVEKL